MSGPVQPPLTVETIDGATVGRPITTIKVTNGALSVSGSTATLTISGGGGTGTVTSVGSSQAFISIATPTSTPSISIGNASGAATGVLTATDWTTFNGKQDAITLTTSGSSGAATLVGSTLNIPQYSGGGGGTFSGSLANTQVAFGDTAADSIQGSANLTFDGTNLKVGGYTEVGTKITTPTGTDLTLDTVNGTDSGSIVINDGAGEDIDLKPNGVGSVRLGDATSSFLGSKAIIVGDLNATPIDISTKTSITNAPQTVLQLINGTTSTATAGSGAKIQFRNGDSNFAGFTAGTIHTEQIDTTNHNMFIKPQGTGKLSIGTLPFKANQTVGAGQDNYILTYDNSTDSISLEAASGGVTFPLEGTDGSASAPTYSFSSASNLGFFKDGSTAVSFTSGGTRQMSFDTNGVIRLGGSASNLSTYSNNLVLDTDLGVNSGSIAIEAGVNGQISLNPDGTGKVKLDGVELDNTAIATGYILKASSTTVAGWVAESGGSGDNGALTGVTATFASNSRYAIGKQMPLVTGSNASVTTGFAYQDDGFLIPFIYPKDGAITEFGVCFGSTGGSGGIKVAVYTSDSDGIPSTLLARSDIADPGSGNTYSTTIVGPSSGSAATASKGDFCWFAFTRFDGATNTAAVLGPSGNSGIIGPSADVNSTTPNCYRYSAYDASTTWPDTINNSTATADNNLRLCPTIKVA